MDENINTKADHSFVMLEVFKCHDDIRNKTKLDTSDPNCKEDDCEVDPKCADDAAITTWRQKKKLVVKMLNENVDMSHENIYQNPNSEKTKHSEIYMPAIPLKETLYTDSGYRLRKNIYSHLKNWLF